MKNILLAMSTLLLASCSLFHGPPDKVKTLHYICGTLPLTVQLDNNRQEVNVILDGNPLTLKRQMAASATRYADGHYVFGLKGETAFIERNGKVIIDDCRLNITQKLSHQANLAQPVSTQPRLKMASKWPWTGD